MKLVIAVILGLVWLGVANAGPRDPTNLRIVEYEVLDPPSCDDKGCVCGRVHLEWDPPLDFGAVCLAGKCDGGPYAGRTCRAHRQCGGYFQLYVLERDGAFRKYAADPETIDYRAAPEMEYIYEVKAVWSKYDETGAIHSKPTNALTVLTPPCGEMMATTTTTLSPTCEETLDLIRAIIRE